MRIGEFEFTSDNHFVAMEYYSNFRINKSDIVDTAYDKNKKWGMGYYPHDGKVYVKTRDGRKREFIILGAQSGQDINNRLR